MACFPWQLSNVQTNQVRIDMSGNWRRGAPPPPVGGPTGAFGRPYSGGVPARPHGPPQPQAQAGPTEWERARGAHAQPRQPEANVDVVIPPCPSQFPQIQSMPVEELRRLVNDSSAFDGFIRDHHYRQYVLFFLAPKLRPGCYADVFSVDSMYSSCPTLTAFLLP